MNRIYNKEWLVECELDDDIQEELAPLDDDWISEEYRDSDPFEQ